MTQGKHLCYNGSTEEAKQAIFVVVEAGKGNKQPRIVRVNPGDYSWAGYKSVFRAPKDKLTFIDQSPKWFGTTIDEVRDLVNGRLGLETPKKPQSLDEIPTQARAEMDSIVVELSPENLSCDGELSPSKVRSRKANLMQRWRRIERENRIRIDPGDFEGLLIRQEYGKA